MLRKFAPRGAHEEGHILRKFGLRRGTTATKIAILPTNSKILVNIAKYI